MTKSGVFVGYTYVNIDTNNLSTRQNANGWEVSPHVSVNKWLALEFDVNGYYKTYSIPLGGSYGTLNVPVRDYSYLAGPRFSFRPLFVHALLGGDHLSASVSTLSASQDSLAGAFGGGVEWPLSRHLAVRASSDYVFTRHNILGGPSVTQNNIRVSAGIVFTFGGGREGTGRAPSAQATPSQPTPKVEFTSLGVAGYPTDEGFKVTSVRAGSPAAQIFLKPGDVISKIDNQGVKSGQDIDAAVGASATGTVTVAGLTQTAAVGMIPFEKKVKLR